MGGVVEGYFQGEKVDHVKDEIELGENFGRQPTEILPETFFAGVSELELGFQLTVAIPTLRVAMEGWPD